MKIFRIIISILMVFVYAGCEDDRLKFPLVESNPGEITLTSEEPMAQIDLFSTDEELYEISWKVTYKPEWLTIDPGEGFIGSTLFLTAITEGFLAGTYTDKIVVVTRTNELTIPVTLVVLGSVSMQFDPEELSLNETTNSTTTTLKNLSNQPVNWQLTPSVSFLSVTPASGLLNPNQSVMLTVNVNRSILDRKVYNEQLVLEVEGEVPAELPVAISNLLLLQGQVVDAEYNRAGDNLIIVTNNMSLVKVNPVTNALTTVTLPLIPTCVSVGQDGMYAIVGHENSITRVNLVTMQIAESYPVSTKAADVVLAPNNYAYVFPAGFSWDNIRCINLDTGEETLHTGWQIHGSTKAKLHPSGDYIYGTNNGFSPSDAEKYDIRSGQASYLYDSPYHGEHYFDGELWISDNGTRMYTRSRDRYRLSTDQAQDIIYDGALAVGLDNGVKCVDHHSAANRVGVATVFINTQLPNGEIMIYSADALSLMSSISISDLVTDAFLEAHYAFFTTAGTNMVVVYKTDSQWGVITIDVN